MRYIDTLISHDRKNNLELILYLVKFGSMILLLQRARRNKNNNYNLCFSFRSFCEARGGFVKTTEEVVSLYPVIGVIDAISCVV